MNSQICVRRCLDSLFVCVLRFYTESCLIWLRMTQSIWLCDSESKETEPSVSYALWEALGFNVAIHWMMHSPHFILSQKRQNLLSHTPLVVYNSVLPGTFMVHMTESVRIRLRADFFSFRKVNYKFVENNKLLPPYMCVCGSIRPICYVTWRATPKYVASAYHACKLMAMVAIFLHLAHTHIDEYAHTHWLQHTPTHCNTHRHVHAHGLGRDFSASRTHTHWSIRTHTCTATHCNTLQHTATHVDTLQHTVTHCNTLQHTTTHYNTLQYTAAHCSTRRHTATHCNAMQRTATHYNTLQHTATRCNTRQHTATPCNTLQRTATHCNTLQDTTTHCNTLQHTATHVDTLLHTARHCKTLQHTTIHYNTLQHTATHGNTRRHTAAHCNTL